jgi:hypothetical protein
MSIRTNEELDPNEGPGLGCFTVQAILFAVILLIIPVGLFQWGWPVPLLAALLFVDLVLLFFISMTSVFLLRVFFADRRRGRGRQVGVAKPPAPRVISTASSEPPAASSPASAEPLAEPLADDDTDEDRHDPGDR